MSANRRSSTSCFSGRIWRVSARCRARPRRSISITAILLDDREKDSLFNNISYLIQKGQKEGDVTGGDPDDIATTFTYIFKGYCSSYLTHKRNKPMLPDKDIVLELFRRRSRI